MLLVPPIINFKPAFSLALDDGRWRVGSAMVGRGIGRSGKELGMNTHGLGDGPLFKFWFGLMGIERYGDQIVSRFEHSGCTL